MAHAKLRRVQASEKALNINEIINEIISHLSELPDLYHCALVNRSWYDVAIPLMWREAPSWDTLTSLESMDALSKYLPHVRRQVFRAAECDAICRLDPPTKLHACVGLRTMDLRLTGTVPVPELRHLLQPALRTLMLSGRDGHKSGHSKRLYNTIVVRSFSDRAVHIGIMHRDLLQQVQVTKSYNRHLDADTTDK